MSQPRLEGTLKQWNDPRGFGFITANDDGQDIFVHITAFPNDGYLPTQGEVLTFEVEPDRNGRPSAVRVQRTGAPATEVAKAAGRARKPRMSRSSGPASGWGRKLIVLLLLVVLALFAYSRYAKRVRQMAAPGSNMVLQSAPLRHHELFRHDQNPEQRLGVRTFPVARGHRPGAGRTALVAGHPIPLEGGPGGAVF